MFLEFHPRDPKVEGKNFKNTQNPVFVEFDPRDPRGGGGKFRKYLKSSVFRILNRVTLRVEGVKFENT